MIIYLVYICITLALSLAYDSREDSRQKRVWYGMNCLFLILVAGLRNGVGGDTLAYMDEYEYAPTGFTYLREYITDMMTENGYMPLWSTLMVVCHSLSEDFYLLQFVQAAVVNITIFAIFRQYTQRIFLCALIYAVAGYFFLFNTEVLREGMAIAMSLIAIQHYFKGDKIRFWVFVLIGILFHVSAAVVLFFPLIRFIRLKWMSVAWGLFAAFVLWFVSDMLVNHMPAFIENSQLAIALKILKYSNLNSNIFGFLSNSLRYLCFPFFVMMYTLNEEEDESLRERKEHLMAYMFIVGILSIGLTGFARLRNYTEVYYLIALSEFIYLYVRYPKNLLIARTIVLAGVLFYGSLFYTAYYASSHKHHYAYYFPYTSIMDEPDSYNFRYEMHDESVKMVEETENTRTK